MTQHDHAENIGAHAYKVEELGDDNADFPRITGAQTVAIAELPGEESVRKLAWTRTDGPHSPLQPPVLRGYQESLVEDLRAAYRAGYWALLLQLATGGGKTIIFAAVIATAYGRGKSILVVAHRVELIRQASAKMTAAGVPHGIIAPWAPATNHAVQVGSIQTLARRLNRLPKFDLLVLDEAHHSVAGQWAALLASQPQARILGVTATPVRLDGKGLGKSAGGFFDVLVQGPSVAELTALTFLAPARYFVPERKIDTTGVRKIGGDYATKDIEGLVSTARIVGDAVESYRRHADHQPAIAFCVSVAHGEAVAAQFRDAGYRSACVHGELPADERGAMIAGLGNGEIEVLCSCELISEGLDVPSVGAVILLRPTESLGLHLQQIGRGLRPAPGKVLLVLDCVGNVITHGRADEEHHWSLDGEVKKPGIAPEKTCPECGASNHLAAQVCEHCGYEFPIQGRAVESVGQLVELTDERITFLAAQPHWKLHDLELSKAEVQAIEKARGYKPGWWRHYLREQAERHAGATP